MVNANKFVIIGIEAFGMHTKAQRKSDRSNSDRTNADKEGDDGVAGS